MSMTDPGINVQQKRRRSQLSNYNTKFDMNQQADYTHYNTSFNQTNPAVLTDLAGTEILNINSDNTYDK